MTRAEEALALWKERQEAGKKEMAFLRSKLADFPEGFEHEESGDTGAIFAVERCNFGWAIQGKRGRSIITCQLFVHANPNTAPSPSGAFDPANSLHRETLDWAVDFFGPMSNELEQIVAVLDESDEPVFNGSELVEEHKSWWQQTTLTEPMHPALFVFLMAATPIAGIFLFSFFGIVFAEYVNG